MGFSLLDLKQESGWDSKYG